MSYVLGIDPSITSTGICLIHNDKEPEYHTIGAKSGQPLGKRLWHLQTLLMSCIPTGSQPLLAAIETPISPIAAGKAGSGAGFNNNIMAYAICYEMLGKFRISYVELSPHQLKMVATGKGNANKDDVGRAYWQKINGEADNNNEIDAYWLAYAGWEVMGSKLEKWSSLNPWCDWLTLNTKTYDMLEGLEINYP